MVAFRLRIKPGRRVGDDHQVIITTGKKGSLIEVRVHRPTVLEAIEEAMAGLVAAGGATNEQFATHFDKPDRERPEHQSIDPAKVRRLHPFPAVLPVRRKDRDDIPF